MAQELPKHVFSKIQKSCSLHQDNHNFHGNLNLSDVEAEVIKHFFERSAKSLINRKIGHRTIREQELFTKSNIKTALLHT